MTGMSYPMMLCPTKVVHLFSSNHLGNSFTSSPTQVVTSLNDISLAAMHHIILGSLPLVSMSKTIVVMFPPLCV